MTFVISAPLMFVFVMLAFVKSAFERFAPFKLALINDAPDASSRASELPERSALLNMEFRTFAPERSVRRKIADVKSVPVIVAPLIVASDKTADVMFEPVIETPFIFALFICPEVKLVLDTVELAKDTPDNCEEDMFAPDIVAPLKFVLLSMPEAKFVFVILALVRDAPLKSTFENVVVPVSVAP